MVSRIAIAVSTSLFLLVGSAAAQTLTHWQHQAHLRAVVTDELAREFEVANPGVRITTEHIPFGQYFDKLVTALATNTAADVFQVPADMAEQLIGSGFVAPMPAGLMSADEARSTYLPWMLRYVKGDDVYGVPVDAQTLVLFINDQLYAEAGLTPDDYPVTWEEMAAQAKQLTQRDTNGQMEVAGVDTRYFRALLMTAMYGATDAPLIGPDGAVSYGHPDNQAGFDWLADMVRGPDRVRDPEFLPGQRPFDLQRAAFYVNHPSARASIEQAFEGTGYTYSAVPLPKRSADAPDLTVGSHWAWVVNARASDVELAWQWVLHGTSEEAQYTWFQDSGDLPTHVRVACDASLVRDEVDRVILDSLTYALPEMQIGRSEIDPIYARIWERLTLTDDPVETILADAAREHTAINQQAIRDYGAELIEELVATAGAVQSVACP
jgi:multiple sugar transport system substrate-binding protein